MNCRGCAAAIARTHKPPAGVRRHYGHGLCGVCYCQAHYIATADRRRPEPPDEVAIDRVVRERRPMRLRPAERVAAVVQLTARGLSAKQISELTLTTPRTVVRIRSRAKHVA